MQLERASGILLHPTALPSRYGIGDLGPDAYKFIDFLAQSGQTIWQMLPIHPTGYGESPYQAFSAFAGNVLLISMDELLQEGFIHLEDLKYMPLFPQNQVDFPSVKKWKDKLLLKAYTRFRGSLENRELTDYVHRNFDWLHDFALFMALKKHFGGLAWNMWDEHITLRHPHYLGYYENLLTESIDYHYFLQFLFERQWQKLRKYAIKKGITLVGDLPIFISYDSSDTWVNPQLFTLDEAGNPAKVAGVPPDYFSETGQFWGNPHYRWEKMKEDDYFWWRQRIKNLLEKVDVIRVDHFRGFEAYWEIPAGQKTAAFGRWVKGPGEHFFETIQEYLGKLPIIAEDLGFITDEVRVLKDKFGFPGMKILQFLSEENIQANHEDENVVYYTGTHDNDTLWGWYQSNTRDLQQSFDAQEVCWEFIEIVFRSKARWAIIPLQDILCLGKEARMNCPGTTCDNWQWRFAWDDLSENTINKLAFLTKLSAR